MGGLTNHAPPTWLEDLAKSGYVVDLRCDGIDLTGARMVEAEDLHGG
jgi:hypothetical protein